MTGNFWSVVTMTVLPDSSASLSCMEVVSMFSTTPSVLLELAHRRLKLAIQQFPVGNHDDGIEDALVSCIVERGQLMR